MTQRRVTCYYFYLWDEGFGPAFIKVCAYFPYPVKVWLNGHEWAKQQLVKAGIGFTELSNGFASYQDPAVLQALCDRLGPGAITAFFERWMPRIPLPLTAADRAAWASPRTWLVAWLISSARLGGSGWPGSCPASIRSRASCGMQ